MSRSLGNVIADSLQLSLGYAERLLKDVPAERCARVAAPGGVVVTSNHPAFGFGHLSRYAPKILQQIGLRSGRDLLGVFRRHLACIQDVEHLPPAVGRVG